MKNKILDIKYVILLGLLIANVQFVAAQIKITGVVTDCEGEPLYGATVLLEKHGGTVTNKQGYYKVMVPDTNSVLTYSFVGYQPQKIRVGNRDTINVALREKNRVELDSITVKGYNKKKKSITVRKPVIYIQQQK